MRSEGTESDDQQSCSGRVLTSSVNCDELGVLLSK